MAKRNIAKTAIEGGRVWYCRYEEKICTRAERREIKNKLHQVSLNPELGEQFSNPPRRFTEYGREFADKLSPVLRWLDKQVGRPWNKVYSEICQKFDKRSTPGRHIVEGHLFYWVNHHYQDKDIGYWVYPLKPGDFKPYFTRLHYWKYEIDSNGILRKTNVR